MSIEKNKVVSLIYELRESDPEGRVIETLDDKKPLTFIFGSGRLLPEFESNIYSLNNGDRFKFTLNSEKAYGDKREDMIINVPLSVFEIDGKIDEEICRVGNEVPMMDPNGNSLNGIINEINETHVKMDFNHPMAGINLYFTGKIIDVHDTSDDELAESMNSCSACGSKKGSGCSCTCG